MTVIAASSLKDQAIRTIGIALVKLAEEQSKDIRESRKNRLYGMAELARDTGILEARLTYSLEGHIDEIVRGKVAPKLRPDSDMDW